jgi:CelD/BcsL family acetyltransferase involved in cellulose biosynthesis
VVARETARLNVVEVVDVDACTDPRWRDLVADAGGSLFHGVAWSTVLADTYGFAPRALVALDGGRVRSGIPWCHVRDPGGERIVSLPFSDYCGPIGAPPFTPLFDALVARGLPVRCRVLVDTDAPDTDAPDTDAPDASDATRVGVRSTKRARWHGVPVTVAPEVDTWPELGASTRRAVAKARREGVEVVARPDPEFVACFFALHAGVRTHKYRLLPQPRAFFTTMRDRFAATDDWFPLAAVRDGEVIAATVFVRHHDTLFYKFNASDPAGLAARPNDLLLWSGIELAAHLGCRLLDLGASDDDQPGLVRFKRGFGASEREIRTLVAGPPPPEDAEQFQHVLRRITRTVTAPGVPEALAEEAGAWLYRYFA